MTEERLKLFVDHLRKRAINYRTDKILLLWFCFHPHITNYFRGDDFRFQLPKQNFKNMDFLMNLINSRFDYYLLRFFIFSRSSEFNIVMKYCTLSEVFGSDIFFTLNST